MEGTDLTPYQEDDPNKDLTYYGNGCSVDGGSKKPGSTRIIETYDNENQAMGTYYDYQAAASGSGGTNITADNTNVSDTFCPLGWQMPYAGTGGDYYDKSRSWSYLFSIYNYNNNQAGVEGILSYPLSNIQAGNIYWPTITLYDMTIMSRLWSTTNSADWGAYRLSVHLEGKNYLIGTGGKGNGHSVRCDFDISDLESFPWHPRSLISIMAFHFLKAHFPSVKIMSNYLKNETKYFIFMELRANFDEAESKYKMENRILMSE